MTPLRTWRIKTTEDRQSNRLWFLVPILVIILFSSHISKFMAYVIPVHKDSALAIIEVVFPFLAFIFLGIFYTARSNNTCIFELYTDRFIRIYDKKWIGNTPADRTVMFDDIQSYSTSAMNNQRHLEITMKNPNHENMDIKVNESLLSMANSNAGRFKDFIQALESNLSVYQSRYPTNPDLRRKEFYQTREGIIYAAIVIGIAACIYLAFALRNN